MSGARLEAWVARASLDDLRAMAAALDDAAQVGAEIEAAGMRPRFAVEIMDGADVGKISVTVLAEDGNGERRAFALCARGVGGT